MHSIAHFMEAEYMAVGKEIKCLKCREVFSSLKPDNRLCNSCHTENMRMTRFLVENVGFNKLHDGLEARRLRNMQERGSLI